MIAPRVCDQHGLGPDTAVANIAVTNITMHEDEQEAVNGFGIHDPEFFIQVHIVGCASVHYQVLMVSDIPVIVKLL